MRTDRYAWHFAIGSLFVFVILQLPAHAAEPLEGVWARTQKDCLDSDRPTSRTLIDLSNVIDKKSSPIFDQYENHCKVVSKTAGTSKTMLNTICFAFWDDFRKGVDGRTQKIELDVMSKSRLKIDGALYRRCETTRRKAAP